MALGIHSCANVFISYARPASLRVYCEEHVYISDCLETVYVLPLLPNNTAVKHFYTNWKRCEVLTGYILLERRSGGNWANT